MQYGRNYRTRYGTISKRPASSAKTKAYGCEKMKAPQNQEQRLSA